MFSIILVADVFMILSPRASYKQLINILKDTLKRKYYFSCFCLQITLSIFESYGRIGYVYLIDKTVSFYFLNAFFVNFYSQASFESKLDNAIPNACKAHIGYR